MDPKTIEQMRFLTEFMKKYFPNYKFADRVIFYADPRLYPTRKAYGLVNSVTLINGKYLVRISTESLNSNVHIFAYLWNVTILTHDDPYAPTAEYGKNCHDHEERIKTHIRSETRATTKQFDEWGLPKQLPEFNK